MRTECPICGLPGLQSNDCETEPIDCIFCPRCGWVGDGEIADDSGGETDALEDKN